MKPLPSDIHVVDRLVIEKHASLANLAKAASLAAAACIAEAISLFGQARVVFGCAPSQDQFFEALVDPQTCGVNIDWSRVTVFHMDEYVGLRGTHQQSFRYYLKRHFLDRVNVGRFHPIEAENQDTGIVCLRYAALLRDRPIDLICLGIGENAHIAFNDPPYADFNDPELVKVTELDSGCRQQQVNDGCFHAIGEVPRYAITITIPVFRTARRLIGIVPGERKAKAVNSALTGRISEHCPASVLRTHSAATLYLEPGSASAWTP